MCKAMPTPPTRPALRARYDARRAQVVAAAASLFAARGYHATSIEDLLTQTGLTRGGLYHYMDAKQDLLLAVLDELMEPLLERARVIVAEGGTPERQLRAVTRAWLEHVAAHRDHMVVFNQERRTLERDADWQHVRAARRAFEELLGDVLARGVRSGDFAIPDPPLTLLALLGMGNHTAQWFVPGGRLDAAAIADGYCDLLLDGIRAVR
jgi:TetR/AcrR family transcriptional regulator, cholesterol catabolism regulator